MTFEATIDAAGGRQCSVNGYPVPEQVYDTLHPSKLFPVDTGMTYDEALGVFESVRAGHLPPEHRGPYLHTAIAGAKPLKSEALAVHRKQIPAVMERNKKHGVNVRYDRSGRPVFTDAGQRRALMKLEGVRQMNSFYGA